MPRTDRFQPLDSYSLNYIAFLNIACPLSSHSSCSPWLLCTSAAVTTVLVMRKLDFKFRSQTALWPYRCLSTSLVELSSWMFQGYLSLNRFKMCSTAYQDQPDSLLQVPAMWCSSCSAGSNHKEALYFLSFSNIYSNFVIKGDTSIHHDILKQIRRYYLPHNSYSFLKCVWIKKILKESTWCISVLWNTHSHSKCLFPIIKRRLDFLLNSFSLGPCFCFFIVSAFS